MALIGEKWMPRPLSSALARSMNRRKVLGGLGVTLAGVMFPPGLLVAGEGRVQRLKLKVRQRLRHGGVLWAAWSPDGKRLVSAGHPYVLWDPHTGEKLHELHEPWAAFVVSYPVRFTAGGRHVLVESDSAKINGDWVGFGLWNVETGQLDRQIPFPKGYYSPHSAGSPCFVPIPGHRQALVMFYSDPGQPLFIYDTQTWEVTDVPLRVPEGGARSLAISPDGRLLVIGNVRPGDYTGDPTGRIWVYDIASGELVRRFEGVHKNTTGQVVFSPDGRLIASSPPELGASSLNVRTHKLEIMNDRDPVRLWDVETGQKVMSFDGAFPGASNLAFHPTQPWVAGALGTITGRTKGPEFRIWDWSDGNLLTVQSQYSASAECIEFSPDGRFVAMAGTNKWGADQVEIAEIITP